MDYVLYLLRALYRVKWWILLGTALITAIVYFRTGNLKGGYNVEATLYTGVVSGYGVEESTKVDWALAQNSMDNLINIIQAESTLKRVSLRLFSRILVKGSPDKDNEGITAASYNYTYNHMKNSPDGKALIALIDRTSEDKTMENFQKYERQDKNNYIYGLFYFQHVYYSYQALKNIKVERKGSSDLLKVSYQSGDPGIAYNTIEILMKEFVNEYQALRYEGTDKVIEYFKAELKRIGGDLTKYEDDLTQYNVVCMIRRIHQDCTIFCIQFVIYILKCKICLRFICKPTDHRPALWVQPHICLRICALSDHFTILCEATDKAVFVPTEILDQFFQLLLTFLQIIQIFCVFLILSKFLQNCHCIVEL